MLLSVAVSAAAAVPDLDAVLQDMTMEHPWITYSSDWPANVYSFVHLSDTQWHTALDPDTYLEQCQWIADNRSTYNIRFVAHSGDVVDNMWLQNQWDSAVEGVHILENAEIPRMIVAGNHDIDHGSLNYSHFLYYFNANKYVNNYTDMYVYNDGEAQIQLVPTGNGHTWMFVGLGYYPTNSALKWAAGIMDKYRQYPAVIVLHDFLDVNGKIDGTGERVTDALITPFPNTRLVLCGHNHAAAINEIMFDDDGDGAADRRVYALLADYQADSAKGDSNIRLLTISEPDNQIYVRTYNTLINDFVPEDEFILPMDSNWFAEQD